MFRPALTALAVLALALPSAALAASAKSAAPKGDVTKGEASFKAKCAICHYVVEDGKVHIAPLLRGVVGRPQGSYAAFKGYSPALKASGKTWTAPLIDQFLTAPATLVPGTFMVINLPDATERQNVVAYLASLK